MIEVAARESKGPSLENTSHDGSGKIQWYQTDVSVECTHPQQNNYLFLHPTLRAVQLVPAQIFNLPCPEPDLLVL